MKPSRNFVGAEGFDSKDADLMGPGTLSAEIDLIHKMFDPLLKHINGEGGGIRLKNLHDEVYQLLSQAVRLWPSTNEPDDAIGEDGDWWMQYEE